MPKGPLHPDHAPPPRAGRVAVVVSRYNAWITDRLLEGALAEHERCGGRGADVEVVAAPGSFELPALCKAAASTGRFEAVVALGCLIRGETTHDQHIAAAVADGLTRVALDTGVPVAFGVLTVANAEQAEARAGGAEGNKGTEAMRAALQAAAEIARVRGAAP